MLFRDLIEYASTTYDPYKLKGRSEITCTQVCNHKFCYLITPFIC